MKNTEAITDLIPIEDALLMLKTPDEVHSFLKDVLSPREHQRLKKRWCGYQLRMRGMSLSQIVANARVAMATATRIAALQHTSSPILETVISRAGARDQDGDAKHF